METKILEIIKDESEKADVRKYTCINGFGYSQFERNIAERIVKLFAIPAVVKSVCEYGMNPDDCIRKADTCFKCLKND